MGNDDYLDDGYVAALLAQDAKNAGNMYSSSVSKPAHKPKPNTRFLRNIIKDTDSHNAALLAKEAAESRARLKGLVNEGREIEKESQRKPTAPLDVRKRQLGDIAAILGGRGGSKRKRDKVERDSTEEERLQRRINSGEVVQRASDEKEKPRERRSRDEDDDMSGRQRRHRSSSRERRKNHDEDRKTESKSNTKDTRPRRGSSLEEEVRSDSKDEGRRKRRRREKYSEDEDYERRHRRHRRDRSTSQDGKDRDAKKRKRHRSRSKSRSPSPHRHRHKDSRRSRSPRRNRSRSPESRRESHRKSRHSPSVEKVSSPRHRQRNTQQKEDEEYDSDPLSLIIGPPPPPIPEVRSRGRGAFSHGAGIDSRFSADYDPTADVQLDLDEENDWDQALEALRDRQKWKKQGAERLRAAGFTDEEIRKWEKGGEKTEEDVKWAKRGESREWDRGKIIDNDGVVSIEPAFGRLKDS